MELKQAFAISLIVFCAATCVALLARTLDYNGADKLAPHLEKIAHELELLRKQGGLASGGGQAVLDPYQDGVVVYYFHTISRCPPCKEAEKRIQMLANLPKYKKLTEQGHLAVELISLGSKKGKQLGKTFGVTASSAVVAKMKGGKVAEKQVLTKTQDLAFVGDKFDAYVSKPIDEYLPETEAKQQAEKIPPVAPPESTPEPTTQSIDLPVGGFSLP